MQSRPMSSNVFVCMFVFVLFVLVVLLLLLLFVPSFIGRKTPSYLLA